MADEPQPYQALYRRFRPQRFSEVLGQDHVTRALRAAVRDGKVAHAYLFSGPRGTGKTSTARILAMALNCESPLDGEPDGTCASCVAVRQGASMDVQELDSATNRGIDEMRDLLSRVALGTPGRWKVYIVDEVHQMTSAASSALLKTLEEPPAHVIFVLATTDPQKVMETIRSRTQHFEFHLLGSEVLAAHLADVAKQASLDLPPEAIDVAVRRGHGSARDALSVLDQVAASGGTDDEVAPVGDLIDAMVDKEPGAVLVAVAEAARAGMDPRRLGTDLLEYLRNGFLATRAPTLVMLTGPAAEEAEARARQLGAAGLLRAMETIGQALIDMRDAADARTTLEVALVRLADPELDDSRTALLERIERLERAVAAGGGAPGGGPVAVSSLPPPPPLPSAPPSEPGSPRPALGAHRRGASAPAPPPPPPSTPSAQAGPPPSSNVAEVVPPPAPGHAPPAVSVPPVTPAAGQSGDVTATGGGPVPSREELTLAWGDRILPALRPAIKVYVASGRFLASTERGAVFAVPDRGLLSRAMGGVADIESALAAHFGTKVSLELVLDEGADPVRADGPGASAGPAAPPGAGPGAGGPPSAAAGPAGDSPGREVTGPPEDGGLGGADPSGSEDRYGDGPEDFDLSDLEDAPGAVLSPEQRLLEAFPGAEEVQQ